MVASLVIGIIFLVAGLGLRYWINRRKFYRRSPMGAEGFHLMKVRFSLNSWKGSVNG
jgi:hypothetical protein